MNSKLKILLITIFLFILINKINYSITNENLEETYIQVKVRKIKDDFFSPYTLQVFNFYVNIT